MTAEAWLTWMAIATLAMGVWVLWSWVALGAVKEERDRARNDLTQARRELEVTTTHLCGHKSVADDKSEQAVRLAGTLEREREASRARAAEDAAAIEELQHSCAALKAQLREQRLRADFWLRSFQASNRKALDTVTAMLSLEADVSAMRTRLSQALRALRAPADIKIPDEIVDMIRADMQPPRPPEAVPSPTETSTS